MADPFSDAWYPHADTYWVGPARAGEYPLRFGDLCPAPVLAESSDSKGRPWTAAVVLMPSCELNAKAKPETRVALARVRRVNDLGQRQRGAVRVGWQERDGRVLIAHGYTFWMPPASKL